MTIWEPKPNTRQQHYNKKYPIQQSLPAYFEDCSSIKVRKITDNKGRTFHGELNGKGRSWGIHHIESCLPCQKKIEDIFITVMKDDINK